MAVVATRDSETMQCEAERQEEEEELTSMTHHVAVEEQQEDHDLAIVTLRNNLKAYMDDVRSLITIDPKDLPAFSLMETLDEVDKWLQDAKDAENAQNRREMYGETESQQQGEECFLPPTLEEYRSVEQQFREQMEATGVALEMELRCMAARKEYLTRLADLLDWVRNTRWYSGARQPLFPSERALLVDFCDAEKRWAEKKSSICSARSDFITRIEAIKKLHNDGALAPVGSTAAEARFRVCAQHVAEKATVLRSQPPDELSVEQRRQAARTATEVLEHLDTLNYHFIVLQKRQELEGVETAASTTVNSTDFEGGWCGFEALEELLTRVSELTMRVMNAADIVNARNTLTTLLDALETAVNKNSRIIESIGRDSVDTIQHFVDATHKWLTTHPDPSLSALNTLLDELREVAFRHGLSQIEHLNELVVNVNQLHPREEQPHGLTDAKKEIAIMGSSRNSQMSSVSSPAQQLAASSSAAHSEPENTSAEHICAQSPASTILVDTACIMLEELQTLKIEITTQTPALQRVHGGVAVLKTFTQQDIRPFVAHLNALVEEEDDSTTAVTAMSSGSPNIQFQAAQKVAKEFEALLEKLRAVCDANDISFFTAPASCWVRLHHIKESLGMNDN